MDKILYVWSKTNRWHLVLTVFLVVELRLIPKRQLGFECNDPALSHDFTGDTISMKWLLASVVFLPLATLLMTEKIYNQDKRSKQQAVHWYKEYLFGLLVNMTVVQTLKIIVGEPRPHFFDTCSPKEASTCTGTEYVSSYTCVKGQWLNQSDTSFPSGHASLAIHTGFFLAYYLHRRTRHHKSNIVLPIQAVLIVSAMFCAVSRIIDRRHHWWDVLAGVIIAIPILLYTIFSLCRNFYCPVTVPEENTKQSKTALLSEQSQESL